MPVSCCYEPLLRHTHTHTPLHTETYAYTHRDGGAGGEINKHAPTLAKKGSERVDPSQGTGAHSYRDGKEVHPMTASNATDRYSTAAQMSFLSRQQCAHTLAHHRLDVLLHPRIPYSAPKKKTQTRTRSVSFAPPPSTERSSATQPPAMETAQRVQCPPSCHGMHTLYTRVSVCVCVRVSVCLRLVEQGAAVPQQKLRCRG